MISIDVLHSLLELSLLSLVLLDPLLPGVSSLVPLLLVLLLEAHAIRMSLFPFHALLLGCGGRLEGFPFLKLFRGQGIFPFLLVSNG